MMSEEQLETLLPRIIAWSEQVASEAQGIPLNERQTEIAKRVGVAEPERVRVVICEKLPMPDDEDLRKACGGAGCFNLAVALTIDHTIWIKRKKDPLPRVPGPLLNPDGTRMSFSQVLNFIAFDQAAAAAENEKFHSALSHELRHVYHHEQTGSVARFAELNWRETLRSGYENNCYEIDARRYEIPLWRSAVEMAALVTEELQK